MSIDINLVLKRNGMNIQDFILKNNLSSYEEFCRYCKSRKLTLIDEEDYNQLHKILYKENYADDKSQTKKESSKNKAKQTVRNASKSQTKTKRRTRTKKVSNT